MAAVVFDKLALVRSRIAEAASRVGRSPDSVELMAVVKYAENATIRELLETHQVRHIGENKIQDVERHEGTYEKSAVERHFIGHLQKNKAKKAVQMFDWIDSVDSLELAQRLDKDAAAAGKTQKVLVQVQPVSNPGQSGIQPGELGGLLEAMRKMPHLSVRGLMAIAPMTDPVEAVRPVLGRMKALLDGHFPAKDKPVLSMGMSRDFEVAIEEGATMVRIGSLLFGDS